MEERHLWKRCPVPFLRTNYRQNLRLVMLQEDKNTYSKYKRVYFVLKSERQKVLNFEAFFFPVLFSAT